MFISDTAVFCQVKIRQTLRQTFFIGAAAGNFVLNFEIKYCKFAGLLYTANPFMVDFNDLKRFYLRKLGKWLGKSGGQHFMR